MKTSPLLCVLLAIAAFGAGCASSPKSRIQKNQAAFDSYPAEVQTKIRAGEVAVGFTPEQVKIALGEADRVLSRTSEAGKSEVWVYREKSSGLGFGLGLGMGSGSVGTGVGVSTGREFPDERMRVVFTAGRVTSVEQISK